MRHTQKNSLEGGASQVSLPIAKPGVSLPLGLSDVELFKKQCLPLEETDLWQEAARLVFVLVWGWEKTLFLFKFTWKAGCGPSHPPCLQTTPQIRRRCVM